EENGVPIGVVTGGQAIRWLAVRVAGQAAHAGTTPMDIRRDALVGAAHLIEAAHARASALSGKPHYVVATIGRIAMT
ncbi:Zn-dependent hydrolase, partial [Clostridioides difficile]|nr:Zn-dependent hydrolase [Clostridioides difficile]